MGQETYRVELAVEAIDLTELAFTSAQERVSKWQQQMLRTEQTLRRMTGTRWQLKMDVKSPEETISTIERIQKALTWLTRGTWSIALRIAKAPFQMLSGLSSQISALTKIATGSAVQGSIIWPLQLAGNLEQSRIAFETMLGSADKAQSLVTNLQAFAERTPFEFPEVEKDAKKLLALGFAADQVIPLLTAAGNAAAGLGMDRDGIDNIIEALGQMRAKPTTSVDQMNALTDARIPAWELMADSLGVTTDQARKLAEAGGSADEAIQALVNGMNRMFPDAMDRQSKSLNGLLSTIKETFQTRILTAWGEGIRTGVQPYIQAMVDWLEKNRSVVEQWQQTLQGAGKAMADWVVSKVERLQEILSELSQSEVWQQADAFGRLQLLWEKVVVEPFMAWWGGGGKDQVGAIAQEIGEALVRGIAAALAAALPAMFKEAGKIAPFGEQATPLSWLSAAAIAGGTLWLGGKGLSAIRGGVNLYRSVKGLRGAGAAAKGADAAADGAKVAKAAEVLDTIVPDGRTVPSTVAKTAGEAATLGQAAKGAKTAARVTKAAGGGSRFLSFLKGGGKLLGRAAIPWGIASDVLTIATAEPGKERAKAIGGALGGWGGAAAGAAIGTMLLPGIGTALGGVLGGIVGGFGGDWLGRQAGAAVHDAISPEPPQTIQPLPPNLTVEYRPEIRIEASAANATDVLRIIRENGELLADDLAWSLAGRFEMAMSNM